MFLCLRRPLSQATTPAAISSGHGSEPPMEAVLADR
jgi:hypothetical protein